MTLCVFHSQARMCTTLIPCVSSDPPCDWELARAGIGAVGQVGANRVRGSHLIGEGQQDIDKNVNTEVVCGNMSHVHDSKER